VLLQELVEYRLGRSAALVEAKRTILALPLTTRDCARIRDRFHSLEANAGQGVQNVREVPVAML
jgi:hypothetical protein